MVRRLRRADVRARGTPQAPGPVRLQPPPGGRSGRDPVGRPAAAVARRRWPRPRAAADRDHPRRTPAAAHRASARGARPGRGWGRSPTPPRGCSTASSRCRTRRTCWPRGWRASAASTRRCWSRRTGACSRRRRARSSGSPAATVMTPPLSDHILASITRRRRDRSVSDAIERVVHARRPARPPTKCSWPRRCARCSRWPRSTTCRSRPRRAGDRAARGRGRGAHPLRARRQAEAESHAVLRVSPMKILTVVGNRPQFIKAAAVSGPLRRVHEEVLVHTGQHFDDELSRRVLRRARPALARPRAPHLAAAPTRRRPARHAGCAGAGARRRRSRRGARLRRHQLDARGRAGRRPGGGPGRPRGGRYALVRPLDARGAQPRARRPRQRPAAVLVAGRGATTSKRGRQPARSSWSAT